MADVALFHAEPAANSLKVLQALHEEGVALESGYPELVGAGRTPRMMAWLDRVRARPGVAAAMPNLSL